MKDKKEIKPNYAPVYAAALYPQLAKIFHKHGYALAVHGSLIRDFDLIAIPWQLITTKPNLIIKEIEKTFFIKLIGKPVKKNHNRITYTISIGFGHCAIDLSFMPAKNKK